VSKDDETAARNSLTWRALVSAVGVGGISAWLASLLTPTIGVTVCAYGLFGVGFVTGERGSESRCRQTEAKDEEHSRAEPSLYSCFPSWFTEYLLSILSGTHCLEGQVCGPCCRC
jgi:hypothetical protein